MTFRQMQRIMGHFNDQQLDSEIKVVVTDEEAMDDVTLEGGIDVDIVTGIPVR